MRREGKWRNGGGRNLRRGGGRKWGGKRKVRGGRWGRERGRGGERGWEKGRKKKMKCEGIILTCHRDSLSLSVCVDLGRPAVLHTLMMCPLSLSLPVVDDVVYLQHTVFCACVYFSVSSLSGAIKRRVEEHFTTPKRYFSDTLIRIKRNHFYFSLLLYFQYFYCSTMFYYTLAP